MAHELQIVIGKMEKKDKTEKSGFVNQFEVQNIHSVQCTVTISS